MNHEIDAELFTADYEGEPGQRSFFLQVGGGGEVIAFALEKQQVVLLAEKLTEILLLVDPEDPVNGTAPLRDPALVPTEVPVQTRVGAIGIAYEEETDRVVIGVDPFDPEADEDSTPEQIGMAPGGVRIRTTRQQVRAFVLHALAVVEEGRPLCRLCGLPMDPGGHACPASNGHHVKA